MKIDSSTDAAEKLRHKIVRRDLMTDVPGIIVAADEETGECVLHVDGENKSISFGSHGIRIVSR